jgi:hypothetical protein
MLELGKIITDFKKGKKLILDNKQIEAYSFKDISRKGLLIKTFGE